MCANGNLTSENLFFLKLIIVIHGSMNRQSCEEVFNDFIEEMLFLSTQEVAKYCQKISKRPTASFCEFQKRMVFAYNRDGSEKENPVWPEATLLNPFTESNHETIEKATLEDQTSRELLANLDLHGCESMRIAMIAHTCLEMR